MECTSPTLVTAKIIIGLSFSSYFAITGFSQMEGNLFFTLEKASLTSRLAKSMSVPGTKLSLTIARSFSAVETTRSRFDTAPTASSIGFITRDSVSSGGSPPPLSSTLMVIILYDMSGISSTGRLKIAMTPKNIDARVIIKIVMGLLTENSAILIFHRINLLFFLSNSINLLLNKYFYILPFRIFSFLEIFRVAYPVLFKRKHKLF
ncbi:MAG: hypothetical protein ACD_79C00421G0002 [uncultured bacterium]|nr:MAG: hypothetical protein ACD_79C00421G0002 [uncultured bacterium]